jgi:hypothetical protein
VVLSSCSPCLLWQLLCYFTSSITDNSIYQVHQHKQTADKGCVIGLPSKAYGITLLLIFRHSSHMLPSLSPSFQKLMYLRMYCLWSCSILRGMFQHARVLFRVLGREPCHSFHRMTMHKTHPTGRFLIHLVKLYVVHLAFAVLWYFMVNYRFHSGNDDWMP